MSESSPPPKLAGDSAQTTTDSPLTQSTPPSPSCPSSQIPIEIVTDEEMALIEAAFSATRRLSPSGLFQRTTTRSIGSVTLLSKRRLPLESGDIEDGGGSRQQRRNRPRESHLFRFRRKRGIAVTDITATEWCEKQMEFILLVGKPKATKAMKAGSVRHAVLEEEVIKRVKVQVRTAEDGWAIKMMNFMVGVNQLLSDGLTRELPLLCGRHMDGGSSG